MWYGYDITLTKTQVDDLLNSGVAATVFICPEVSQVFVIINILNRIIMNGGDFNTVTIHWRPWNQSTTGFYSLSYNK